MGPSWPLFCESLMGLFSTKKKHIVDTHVQRIIDEPLIPDATLDALMVNIFEGVPIAEALLDRVLNADYHKFERMYRWAEDNYYYKLPDVGIRSTGSAKYVLIDTIEYLYGNNPNDPHAIEPLWGVYEPYFDEFHYTQFRPINHVHLAWEWVWKSNQAYTYEDNCLNDIADRLSNDFKNSSQYQEWLDSLPEDPVDENGEVIPGTEIDRTPPRIKAHIKEVVGYYNVDDTENIPEWSTIRSWNTTSFAGIRDEQTLADTLRDPIDSPIIGGLNSLSNNFDNSLYVSRSVFDHNIEDRFEVVYFWVNPLTQEITEEVYSEIIEYTEDITEYWMFDKDAEYYHVHATAREPAPTEENPEREIRRDVYWHYRPRENGKHRILDIWYEDEGIRHTYNGTFFPFVMFRSEDKDRTSDQYTNTPEQLSTIELLDKINIDFLELGAAIHENPDIKYIDQAVLLMGVPVTTERQYELEYLFTWFKDVHQFDFSDTFPWEEQPPYLPDEAKDRQELYLDPVVMANLERNPNSYAIDIQDADYRTTLSFENLTYSLRGLAEDVPDIGPIGFYTNELETFALPPELQFGPNPDGAAVASVDGTNIFDNAIPMVNWLVETVTPLVKTRVYKHQIYPGIIEEIRLVEPRIRYHIYKNKGAEGGADDERCIFPLDYRITRRLPTTTREKLYYSSLHLVMNSHVVQKTKWYEKGWFKAVIIVVAVVIAVYTGYVAFEEVGALIGAVAGATTGAALASAVIALIKYIFIKLAIGYLISEVLTVIAEQLGAEWALIVAAIAYYYAWQTGQGGHIDIAGTVKVTASQMLMVANGLVAAVGRVVQADMEELQKDMLAFQDYTEGKWDELEEAQALLETDSLLDPLQVIRMDPMFIPGETPDQYYNRVSHNTNPGVESLKLVENFVGYSLTLPRLTETVGETFYG